MNYGLQEIEIKRKDYLLGGKVSLKQVILSKDGQWDKWLPPKEVQNFPIETDACVTFAILNAVEILLRYEFGNTENLSDRFLAYISGTTKHGNNPQNVAEALRTKGDVKEKFWTYTKSLKTWEEVYEAPPRTLYSQALDFIKVYKFGHEWLLATPPFMKQALQYSPLTVAGWAWDRNSQGFYFSPKGKRPEHYFVVYGYVDGEYWKVFDSYDNSLKKLVWDFHFTMVKRFTLHSKVIEMRLIKAIILLTKKVVILLKELMKEKQITIPTNKIIKEIEPRKDKVVTFATAIRDFEGKPGDLNYKNNNPGNFRCSPIGYLSKYGDVKCIGNFAVFPTYQQGWDYLLNSISYRAKKHPQWTFLDFFNNYAPPSDNNPTKSYATFVATRCGVSINTTLSDYF